MLVCSKHCVQKSNNVAWKKRVDKGYDQLQKKIGIPSFHKTIDITQIHVQKPQTIDYFSFKSKGYNMRLQIVVDYHKKIQDIFMEMPDSMNDAKIFQISGLY
jgi:hypothetical protein